MAFFNFDEIVMMDFYNLELVQTHRDNCSSRQSVEGRVRTPG